MNLRQLDAFRCTVLSGSVSGAADVLDVSQPTISRLLVHLETSLGLVLFERHHNRLALTPEGRLMYEEAERTFQAFDRLQELADDIKAANAGSISIASLPNLSFNLLPTAIRRFRESHPRVSISLGVQNSARVEEWIVAQKFDFGFVQLPSGRHGHSVERFCKVPQVLVVPKGHPLATRKSVGPQDLHGVPYISLPKGGVERRLIDSYFDSHNVRREMFLEVQTYEAICRLVEQEQGVSLVDPFTGAEFRRRGGGVVAFKPTLELEFAILFPMHRPVSKAARQFLLTLRACRDEMLKAKLV